MAPRQQSGDETAPGRGRLGEVVRVFAWLGVVGFGGPAAHIAMMRHRIVRRESWVNEDDFARMVGACALVPGPNSTEMAMALGARRAGWRGLLAAGGAFILPAFAIVCAVAWLYEDVLTSAVIADVRRWVVPVVAAIVLDALWSLRTTAVRDWRDFAVVVMATACAVVGVAELLVLGLLGIVAMVVRANPSRRITAIATVPAIIAMTPPSLIKLLFVFLQIGSVIFGSGYVLLVFLDSEVVGRGWITPEVLLDAISVGQFTPGPVFTTATFIGWHLNGFLGAVVATLGIFAPSFFFAGIVERVVVWSKRSNGFAAFLRGVSSASIALMMVVMWRLADEALVNGLSVATFVVAFGLLRARAVRRWMSARR